MKSVCIFIHYHHANQIPYPEETFIKELDKYFSEIILITNERELNIRNLPASVSLKMVQNEGYDFGMFYKAVSELDLNNWDRLALVNDSNILLQSLSPLMSKGASLETPFWGAIDSYEKPAFSTHEENHHLQSHFLVWEKPSFPFLKNYLHQTHIQDFFDEKNLENLRRKVINDWEIGISQYFNKNGIVPRAAFESAELDLEHPNKSIKINHTIKNPNKLLEKGYPFLKKRYTTKHSFIKRLLFPRKKWENLIKEFSFDAQHAEQLILSINKSR